MNLVIKPGAPRTSYYKPEEDADWEQGRTVLTYLNGKLVQMDGVTPAEWLLGETL